MISMVEEMIKSSCGTMTLGHLPLTRRSHCMGKQLRSLFDNWVGGMLWSAFKKCQSGLGGLLLTGMWFTPPDLGVKVMCFFVGGDPNEGYYIGAVPEPGYTHMIPAIGARDDFANRDSVQSTLTRADQLPVTEINNKNTAVPRPQRLLYGRTDPYGTGTNANRASLL